MCHIAELLIELQQVGNVKYTSWILQIPCSRNRAIIDTLQEQTKKMESQLTEWKQTVSYARRDFYELNYYTTIQLLSLRRELSTERGSSDIAPNVLFLLQSISSQVTSSGVRQVVNDVASRANTFNSESLMHIEEIPASRLESENNASVLFKDTLEDVLQRKPHGDMPQLQESDLTGDERNILEYVTRVLDCSNFLVLKAFEMFRGEDKDRYEYRDWCSDNIETFEFEEEGTSDSEVDEDDDAMLSSDSESEEEFKYSQG